MKTKILTGLTIFFTFGTIVAISDKNLHDAIAPYLFLTFITLYYLLKSKNKINNKNAKINNNEVESSIIYNPKATTNYDKNNFVTYNAKDFLTHTEYNFYQKISSLESNYRIIPQVNLASIVNKKGKRFQNELFRNIDFGIFTKDFKLLLLIELNDSTHQQINRRDRDLKVQKILNDCGIKLIKFYTCYPNEQHYVLNRINQYLHN